MEQKKALITGITGQDGAYLADFLLEKGYEVHGLIRRVSVDNKTRISPLLDKIVLHYGDLTDASCLFHIMANVLPDEVYNLGAQSDVAVSFENPEYSANVNALGTLRLLEAIRLLQPKARFYQASTSELFGNVQEIPQKETTPFYPRSPYAVSKLYGFWITVNYRESYGLFACNGILFNHESPLRAESFVTRKVTRGLSRIVHGLQKCLHLGNLEALRDWGHTRDFIEMQWRLLQQEKPKDYVIATGEQHSVRQFVEKAAFCLGITLKWEGEGTKEKGVVAHLDRSFGRSLSVGDVIVRVDPKFFRKAEVSTLLGDATKAYQDLGWKPKITFFELVEEMVEEDLAIAKREALFAHEDARH